MAYSVDLLNLAPHKLISSCTVSTIIVVEQWKLMRTAANQRCERCEQNDVGILTCYRA